MPVVQTPTKMNLAFFVANALGTIIYVMASSLGWTIAQERELGLHSITGEPFIWVTAVFPIWALFFFVNLIWGVIIVRRRQWRAVRLMLAATGIWLVGVVVDFCHH
jgi:hypothetical protein